MATGWPMKTTYADGDVYSAQDVNDITGTINLLGQSVTTSSGKNAIINGGMDIWARGTSFTATGVYTADRWFTGTNSGQTLTRQTTSDTTNLPTIQYCLRASRNSGTSNLNIVGIAQSIETQNSIRFAGQAVTLSFYARKGANLSGTFTATLYSGTGTDQRRDFGAGFTGEATVATSSPTLTTGWVRYTISGTVASTATELAALLYFVPVGTAGAADYIEVTGVQLELGTVTTFARTGSGIQGELAACQRYYWRQTGDSGNTYTPFGVGFVTTTTNAYIYIQNPVPMRIAPASVDYSTLTYNNYGLTLYTVTSVAFTANRAGTNGSVITIGASGMFGGQGGFLTGNGSASAYLGFSAEL
jgi:hypothetical protein